MPGLGIVIFFRVVSSTAILRAAPLARAAAPDYDVELFVFLHGEGAVSEPYRDLFPYKTLRVPLDTGAVLGAIPRLAALATGDIVYACKPVVTSLGPALYAARRHARRLLLLDVEDDEWVTPRNEWPAFLWADVVKGWRH